MTNTFTAESTQSIISNLQQHNTVFTRCYPGDPVVRQPVHTVYGGAHIFNAETARKLGRTALKSLSEYAPTPSILCKALGIDGTPKFQKMLYLRIVEKLQREAVEDFRIDFEDGYGNRPDTEEDQHAQSAAEEVARATENGTLPPFIGIRLKPFSEELNTRSIRTLDIFVTTMVQNMNGKLPENFIVTLPKVTIAEQVTALVQLFELLESKLGLRSGTLKMEIMVETPQSVIDANGICPLPMFVAAGKGRCIGAHFGVYDYTASVNITAAHQTMDHAACDFARHMMKVSLAGTGIMLSDGATNIMPVAPHRGNKLSASQKIQNKRVVHRVWKLGFDHINHSLLNGYYQGWDLHPAQLPIRYAAVYAFFLKGLEATSVRLKTFVEKAAQATLIGEVFDDAATGQGLLNFFIRGINCGAITEEESLSTGLSLDEIRSRSFVKILANRRTA